MRRWMTWLGVVVCMSVAAAAQAPPAKKAAQKASPPKIAGATVPAWPQMEALLRKEWATRHPNETLVAVERIGEPTYSDEPGSSTTTSSTSGSFDWNSWGWNENTFSSTIKGREGSFLRQKVEVTAERANKTRAKFSVAALYKLVGGKWTFAEMPVGKVEELAGTGAPAQPTDADAAKIFAAAWGKMRPDLTVGKVQVLGKQFNQSKGRYWLTYKLAVSAMGTPKAVASLKGKAVKCTPADYSSVLKWNKDAAKWEADESM
ncbi:MAG: hypothetical protein ABIP12_06010, partial [Terriglobales bacterium]